MGKEVLITVQENGKINIKGYRIFIILLCLLLLLLKIQNKYTYKFFLD